MHPLLASKIANWLPFFILIMGCGSAWADTPKTDGGQAFLGQPIDDEPLSGEKRQMLALANRIRQPIRPPRTGGNAAYVPWLNNSYRKRVERDRQALAEFGRLAAKLPDDTQNNALILVLGAFIAEGIYQRDDITEAANPAHAIQLSGGIGLNEFAEKAHTVVGRAKACVRMTSAASPHFAGWSERCQELAVKYQDIEDQGCASAALIGIAQPGMFCGDRAQKN